MIPLSDHRRSIWEFWRGLSRTGNTSMHLSGLPKAGQDQAFPSARAPGGASQENLL